MRIQHNIAAMSSYRNYTNNVAAVNKNLEKLSSGYKINRAGDDAAGLAISEKMRAQITGLESAQKNAKDGISLVKTAEGALTEVHDMLNRMVSLATQSANGTYDNETDRAQLQKEMDQLKTEINRIADSSNFNGIKLLDGSMDGQNIKMTGVKSTLQLNGFSVVQDGQLTSRPAAKGKYSIDFSNASLVNNGVAEDTSCTIALGDASVSITVDGKGTLSGGDLAEMIRKGLDGDDEDGQVVIDSITYNLSVSGDKLVLEMDEVPTAALATDFPGQLTFTPDSTALVGNAAEQFKVTPEVEATTASGRAYGQAVFELNDSIVKDGASIKIGDETYIFALKKSTLEKFSGGNVVDLTDQPSDPTAVNYSVAAQRLATAAKDNARFKVGTDITSAVVSITEKEGGVDYSVNNLAGKDGLAMVNGMTDAIDATAANWKGLIEYGTASLVGGGKSLKLQIGDTSDSYNQLKVNIKDMHVGSMGLDSASISDQESAAKAVEAIKNAINYVSDVRGTLGATQNRLDHTINNLSVMRENIQDAESTIRDTDIAEEMMAYTKNNILVQSAQAMLAQANQIPQGVLQLLG